MPFKINLSEKNGKTYKMELESEDLNGKELNSVIAGKDLMSELDGYEFEITGASDSSGLSAHKNVDGVGLKGLLLTYGKCMHKRSRKEAKKLRSNMKPNGLRLRKTVRGKVISPAISQINMKVVKAGHKKLSEVFPEQNSKKEAPAA